MVLYRRGEEVASLGTVISSMDLDISDETSKDKWYGVSDRWEDMWSVRGIFRGRKMIWRGEYEGERDLYLVIFERWENEIDIKSGGAVKWSEWEKRKTKNN
jgi:hypothetical protein